MEMRLTIKRRARGMRRKGKCNRSKLNELNMFSVWLREKNKAGGEETEIG